MKSIWYIFVFTLLAGTLHLHAQKWGDPIILGEWNKIPGLSDLDYDSLGNIYIQTSYCRWIMPKDKDTLYPITELKDDSKSYKYVVYQNSDGIKNVANPRTKFGENGYVTSYYDEFLFVRNDSIYSINEMLGIDTISTETFEYIGDNKWVFGRRTTLENWAVKYFGFYVFDANLMSVKFYPKEETGGTQVLDFITHYDNSFWYFCYPDIAISKFNEDGYELYYVTDSIHAKNPDFGYVNNQRRVDNQIWMVGEDKSVYSFDMDTYELKQEAKFDNDYAIYKLEQELIDSSDIWTYSVGKTSQNMWLHGISSFKNLGNTILSQRAYYYGKQFDSSLTKIQLKDTTELLLNTLITITNDGKLWFSVKYYPGGDRDQVYQVGVICFDPLAPDTEVVEGQPTIIVGKPYPNPAKTFARIEFFIHPHTKAEAKFTIYNYMGAVVKKLNNEFDYNTQTAIGSKMIDVETLKTGVYYLVIDNGTEQRAIGFAVE